MGDLRIEDLRVDYGRRQVLGGVTLRARAGEVVAVLGPNGAGKTALIRAVSGVLRSARGRVLLDRVDLLRLAPRERARRVGVVPQDAQLPGEARVIDVVLMGRTPHLGSRFWESRGEVESAREILGRLGVRDLERRRVGELSGGERQRVLIARALAQEPSLLLLDEPTSHLDLKHQAGVLDLVRGVSRTGRLTVIAALHDLNVAGAWADRIAFLCDGRLGAFGPPEDVVTAACLREVYGLPIDVLRRPEGRPPLVVPYGPAGDSSP